MKLFVLVIVIEKNKSEWILWMLGPLSIDSICDVLSLTTIMCLCQKVYKPLNLTDRKDYECISLGETARYTVKPRMLYLRTRSTS